MARPTDYNPEILVKSLEYLKTLPEDEVVHSIEGLACYIDVSRKTIYNWADQHIEFLYIVDNVLEKQAKTLANKGLSNEFNASITKLMLTKHGYVDKAETDNKHRVEPITGAEFIFNGKNPIQDGKSETVAGS